jgi:hypothetical protein
MHRSFLFASALIVSTLLASTAKSGEIGFLEDFSLATYGLAPIRTETWQGFVFLCFADESVTPGGLQAQIGDLTENLGRFDFTSLRSAKQIVYEVNANWKFIAENYSECYHCPGVHPQLNKLTPYDLGQDYDPNGAWLHELTKLPITFWDERFTSADAACLNHHNARFSSGDNDGYFSILGFFVAREGNQLALQHCYTGCRKVMMERNIGNCERSGCAGGGTPRTGFVRRYRP